MSVYLSNHQFNPSHILDKYRDYRFDRLVSAGNTGYLKKYDSPDGTSSVMIKKFFHIYLDSERETLIMRELNLLRSMRHPNIVRLLGEYIVSDKDYPDSIYYITNYCGVPLRDVIHDTCDRFSYKMENVKKWMRELLLALQYLHSLEIIHRNLHPGKLCIQNDKLTVVGFGNARNISDHTTMAMHQGIYYYKALEMAEEFMSVPYDEKANIWSASAILFEMITGTILFKLRPIALYTMIEYCGPVGRAVIERIKSKGDRNALEKRSASATRKDFINIMRERIASNKNNSITIADVEKEEEILRDFLDRTLQFDPNARMSATNALEHPFLNESANEFQEHKYGELLAHRLQILNAFSAGGSDNTQTTSGNINLDISIRNESRPAIKIDQKADSTLISDFLRLCKPVSVIGQGAFGCVFKAEKYIDNKLTWTRAVKRIPLQGREIDVDVALREVTALAKLDHPGVVRFYDAWKEQPPHGWQNEYDDKMFLELNHRDYVHNKPDCAFLYILMELCPSTLAKWLSEDKERNLSRMKAWFRQIVSAVGYIHSMDFIHRDLKPTNILIAETGILKICDLGIVAESAAAKSTDGVEIERTYGIGTKMYMAPEQLGLMGKYSKKLDIFSIGLILVEMSLLLQIDDAAEIFDNYRDGIANTCLDHLPEVKAIVAWLTNLNDTERPDCEEILKHDFFAL